MKKYFPEHDKIIHILLADKLSDFFPPQDVYKRQSMTLAKEKLLDIFATATQVKESPELARIIGVNMEGPLIDIQKKGAQAGEYIRVPDASFFRKCNEASGNQIKLVKMCIRDSLWDGNAETADMSMKEKKLRKYARCV